MNFIDTLNLKGTFKLEAVYNDGKRETLVEDNNLIVLNGRRKIISNIMSGNLNYISHVVFGDGGALKDNPAVAIPPTEDEIGLRKKIAYTNPLNTPSYSGVEMVSREELTPPRIIYTISVNKISALNLKGINEMALMMNAADNDNAFAIKRFSTIFKSDAFSLVVTWSIFF